MRPLWASSHASHSLIAKLAETELIALARVWLQLSSGFDEQMFGAE
jgi:hypothetical protein